MSARLPILHIEESEEDVFLLQYAFTRAEITNPVAVVSDGQQAIDYLEGTGEFADRERFPLPCLALLNLKLPKKMGLEVLEWIRGKPEFTWLIVIVLTSSIHDKDVQRAYQLGVNSFLVKPPDTDSLTDMCRALKHFWLVHNRPPAECHP